MKRHPALAKLSRDHHHALVLGKSLAIGAPERLTRSWPKDDQARIDALRSRFAAELEPHFRAEEEVLFPFTVGGNEGLRRITNEVDDDHRTLRAMLAALHPGAELDAQLDRFAKKLEQHVRLEERRWFPALERSLARARLDEAARRLGSG